MSSIVDTPFSNLPQPKSGWQLFSHLASGAHARAGVAKPRLST
jgi:hypothetical protein